QTARNGAHDLTEGSESRREKIGVIVEDGDALLLQSNADFIAKIRKTFGRDTRCLLPRVEAGEIPCMGGQFWLPSGPAGSPLERIGNRQQAHLVVGTTVQQQTNGNPRRRESARYGDRRGTREVG